MLQKKSLIPIVAAGLTAAACSTTPGPSATSIATGAVPSATTEAQKAGTPVHADRPARMYVWAGFMERDCSPAAPAIVVTKPPAKGDVVLKTGETITIQHSTSGKCLGKTLPGTGIYYTAKKGFSGNDTFTVTATTPSGQITTRSFRVTISE